MLNSQPVGAVIVAAGRGERMGGIDKIFAPLNGPTVLQRVVSVFEACEAVDRIVVVLNAHNLERGKRLLGEAGFTKVVSVVPGGERRQDSVTCGLSRLAGCGWVVIHDGARPMLAPELITRGLEEARETGAAICAVPVTDTIKSADENRYVDETLDRSHLWAVQTPQVFRFNLLNKAYNEIEGDVTDDASLVEALGVRVKLYMGAYDNIKLTTPADLVTAEMMWQRRRC